MNGPRRSGPTPTDPAGARRPWRPAPGYLAIALGIVAAGFVVFAMAGPSPVPVAADTAAPPPRPVAAASAAAVAPSRAAPVAPPRATAAASAPAPPQAPQVSRTRDPDGDLTPDLSDYVNSGERPTMTEVIDRLHQAGVYGGLGAFSPPGTRPPLVGLAVPDDFALPPGYVRHYQATDDGQRIEPILMFSPDQPAVDAAQRPIAIPNDRLVPPELAPPGLPIRRIAIPAPTEPGK
jgi:hypothetical protein